MQSPAPYPYARNRMRMIAFVVSSVAFAHFTASSYGQVCSESRLYEGSFFGDYGRSVSISGLTAVVGAPLRSYFCSSCGVVYLYECGAPSWTKKALLTHSEDVSDNDHLGKSISISGDTVVAGAPEVDCASGQDCGAAYVYVKPLTGWIDTEETAELTASDAAPIDNFGASVSISDDVLVVGAPNADCAAGINCGAAYVFVKPVGGWTNMTQVAKLTASDADAGDTFGVSVSISGDTIVVAADRDDCAAGVNCGSVYVFEKPGAGWTDMTQTAKLTGSGLVSYPDPLGLPVAISGDTIVVGRFNAPCAAGNFCGSAHVFVKPGASWTDMTAQTATLTASDAAALDYFGFAVSMDSDKIVIAAFLDDVGSNANMGSIYIFDKPVGGWTDMTQSQKRNSPFGSSGDQFGESVAIDDDRIVVGVPLEKEARTFNSSTCGNGTCGGSENTCNCPADCPGPCCGQDGCEPGENQCNCPTDCGPNTCGNGCCGGNETACNCPIDCGPDSCGNGCCGPNENSCSCFQDCNPYSCGDGCCNSGEDSCNCPEDCPGTNCNTTGGSARDIGTISQYITNQSAIVESSDNVIIPCVSIFGCSLDSITFRVSHTNDAGTALSDTPSDYSGLVMMIANDVDNDPQTPEKGPTCVPIDPPPAPGATAFHQPAPGFPNGCVAEIVLGADQTANPPTSGHYWSWQAGPPAECGTSPCFDLTVHLDPPLVVTANDKHWLGFFAILPDENAGGYNVNWNASDPFDGNNPRQFATGAAGAWNENPFDPPADLKFGFSGTSVGPPCVRCQREGDIFPPGPLGDRGNCNIDIDDLLYLIAAIANPMGFPGADVFGCDNDYPCSVDQDCFELYGFIGIACEDVLVGPASNQSSFQRRCGNVDIDDLSIILNAFAGYPTFCGDTCPPGACKNIPPIPCVVDTDCPQLIQCVSGTCDIDFDAPPNACHDSGIPGAGYSMSEYECFLIGGTYCGDYSLCGDPGCP